MKKSEIALAVCAVVLWLCAAAVAIAFIASCASCEAKEPARLPEVAVANDSISAREIASAVSVTAKCDWPELTPLQKARKALLHFWMADIHGSGFAISPRVVATALHVVDCAVYAPMIGLVVRGKVREVIVHWRGADYKFKVILEGAHDDHDIYSDGALLAPADDSVQQVFTDFAAEIGPPPAIGDQVCVVATVPFLSRSCGPVTSYREGDFWMGNGYVVYDLPSIGGNSGGGVYDAAGRVVAINVATVADLYGGGFVLGAP